ncbi:sensor histidine kinase [Adhaeribacter terreus]|uniref:Sensor histidine kinase n=1 Tax=Adhaeribacter terreus TaxID=529703 RepID=A0ABW0E9P3_9BACT
MPKISFTRLIRVLKLVGHGCFILFLIAFPLYVFYATGGPKEPPHPLTLPFIWWFSLSYIMLFYGNTYYIIPRVLLRKRYFLFLLIVLGLFLVFYFGRPFQFLFDTILFYRQGREIPPYQPFSFDFLSLVLFGLIITLGLCIQIIKQWQRTERRALQAETDKANAELSFLKAQINPHFLFNTLNTIYSLILTRNDLAADSVLKLSSIMRYVTGDATADFVSLEKEIASLTDYIELQKLQHNKKVLLDFTVTGTLENKQIAPLLLLTYIENAFKYGISSHEEAPITIRLEIAEDRIDFFCQNRIFETPRVTERTGIGLLNTRKRLEFLYPGKHELLITSNTEFYTVSLTLKLVN